MEVRWSLKAVYVATALTAIAFVGGYATAGALTILNSGSEAANGNFESATAVSWWTQGSVGLTATPSPLPTSISATTMSAPTVLAATSQSYLLNAGTAGDVAHYFRMTESTSAPASTELEIVYTLSTGAVPVTTTGIVFLETQSTAPSSVLTFNLYYDLGSATSASIVLNSVQQISEQCPSVGSCP